MKRTFSMLLTNFTWWLNRKDDRRNLFEGGFLGLDNIGVFDQTLAAADRATSSRPTAAWMAFYSQGMLDSPRCLALVGRPTRTWRSVT